ncbi:hypothetical protein [Lactobacillus crispatus]|uniref:VWFA domain-containing protein n=1 Tax=Lactobacillus crispatus TaxID=47770 RepID=A0AB37DIK9_9LACO|nr:hypothetical protein [Lactobacillus crispatus]QHQ69078.1 hypothetical protein GSR61_10855 [Lactobacillus crispatus]
MTLLQLICRFGFVNDSQLDMLYSVVQHYPTRFFHPILLKWTQYSGLLQKRKKPRTITSTSVIRNVYIPTKICRTFLNDNGFVLGDDPLVAVNSHNEQAIEVVVQSLYSAMFKASAYVPYSTYLASTTGYKLLMNPEMSVEFMDSDNTTQKNRIILDPEGFRLPDTFIQKNQIWNPEVALRNSKPAVSSSVPTYSLKRHFGFIRSISTAPIDKQLSLITTSTYMSLLDGGIDSNDLSILGNNYPLLSIGNKDYLSINDNKTSSLSSKFKNTVNEKAKGAEGGAIESSYLDKESELKVSGSAIKESGKPRDRKKQSELNGFLNDSSELSNGLKDSSSGRDAHVGRKSSKSVSRADKSPKDNQFINDSQAELDKLLAGVDTNENTVTPTGANLTSKMDVSKGNNSKVTPDDTRLAPKLDKDNEIDSRMTPTGAKMVSKNKKGFIYRLSGVSSPIQITNTKDFKKNSNYSANSALMNLKLISASAASKKPVDAFRYPTANPDNLLRNINLISNPAFEPALLDTSSFKNQYKYQQYTFVADEVVSFSRNGRRQEIFVEQDNRTESNNTQIQKILNYISYALEHPQRDILLMISITDGSLSSPKVPKYTNIGRKLASLSSKFLKSYLSDENGERIFLSQMYKQANNLKIVLSGVSESQIDLTQFLLGSNYSMDYYQTIKKYVTEINKNSSQWNASLELSKEFSTIIHDPELATQPLDKLSSLNENSPAKGLWRYTDTMYASPILGTIHYRNKLSRQRYNQPIIAGDEHSLDTIIQTLELVTQANRFKDTCPPVVIYPHRERPVTAITLNQYRDLYNWLPTWRPTIPVLIQPLTGLKDNLQLHKELRWLTIQYDLDIYNYFKMGAINKFALKKHPDYGNEYVSMLKWSTNTKARSYDELHQLALKMEKKEFVDQLKLNEIPLGLFRTVLERWPKGIYDLPLIEKLPYIDLDQEQPTILEEESILNHMYAPNSVIPSSRIQLQFHNDN